jgi:tetratricopeptide (TPR) repeat protein
MGRNVNRSPESATELDAATAWLRRGHALEAAGRIPDAIAAYDRSFVSASDTTLADTAAARRARALAAMNRGNALQRRGDRANLAAAVHAYDDAIALFAMLPLEHDPALRNNCGTAWLNRGRALQLRRDASSLAAAVASHERAIGLLRSLPENGPAFFTRNLAGAWLNLADALLESTTPGGHSRARDAAKTAADLVASREETDPEFADLGLKARRAFVEALGHLLVAAGSDRGACDALASHATDAIDEGLALARRWESHGHVSLRPLAARLFRFGAQLYRLHQSHFLAEFLLENVAPGAFADDPEFRAIARDALAAARAELARPRLFHLGDRESEKAASLARELAAAEREVAALTSPGAQHAIDGQLGPRLSHPAFT